MQNLKRDPWIGKEFNNQSKRLMIIGESHYAVDDDGNFSQVAYDEFTMKRDSTKWIIEALVKESKTWKVFDNLYRALFGTTDINKEQFWAKVGFYNFIQEPMKSKNQRPQQVDFLNGYECLKMLIMKDEFDTALFLGTTAAKYYTYFQNDVFPEANHRCTHWDLVSTRRRSHIFEVTYKNKVYRLIFIAHPSNYFNWKEWNSYLNKIMPEQITDLE